MADGLLFWSTDFAVRCARFVTVQHLRAIGVARQADRTSGDGSKLALFTLRTVNRPGCARRSLQAWRAESGRWLRAVATRLAGRTAVAIHDSGCVAEAYHSPSVCPPHLNDPTKSHEPWLWHPAESIARVLLVPAAGAALA